MSLLKERMKKVEQLFDVSQGYLTEQEKDNLDKLNVSYEQIRIEDGVCWSGMHFPSLNKALDEVEGSQEALNRWNWVLDGLKMSGNFD